MEISRSEFIKRVGMAGVVGMNLPGTLSATAAATGTTPEAKGLTFLFQGDSITDGNRTRNNDWNHVMGHGYAYLIAARLWYDYPENNLMFYNRGISGNKVKDLDDRWQQDTIDLKPDVLSILIGVNDVNDIVERRTTMETWRATYVSLLEKTKKALPEALLVLCEPFILPADWTDQKAQSWQGVIEEMQAITRQLAKDFTTLFVATQQPFNDAVKKAPIKYWVWDGVHPMPAGHELIARLWISEVRKKLGFIKG